MVWVIFVVILPVVVIIGSILYFNAYMRKKIQENTTPKPFIDQAYLEAEQTRGDDEDFGSVFGGRVSKSKE